MTRSIPCIIVMAGIILTINARQSRAQAPSGGDKPAEDDVAVKLNEAKDNYRQKVADLRRPILAALEKAESQAKKSNKLELLKRVQWEKERFETMGTLPKVVTSQTRNYPSKLKKLNEEMTKALEEAKRSYVNAGNVDPAEAVSQELDRFRTFGRLAGETIPPRWVLVPVSGTWGIDRDALVQTSKGRAFFFLGYPMTPDYDVKVKVTGSDGNMNGAIRFCQVNNFNYYRYSFGAFNNEGHEVLQVIDGKQSRASHFQVHARMPNRAYEMKIQVRRDHYTCFLDGEKVFDIPNGKLSEGGIGLETFESVMRFEGIEVTTTNPDGQTVPLWNGPIRPRPR